VQVPLAQIESDAIVQQLHTFAKIPWPHNAVILDKVKNADERLFYTQKIIGAGMY
jgi:predicted nuclease of restriction endonuclease-like (RecB) superfamily